VIRRKNFNNADTCKGIGVIALFGVSFGNRLCFLFHKVHTSLSPQTVKVPRNWEGRWLAPTVIQAITNNLHHRRGDSRIARKIYTKQPSYTNQFIAAGRSSPAAAVRSPLTSRNLQINL